MTRTHIVSLLALIIAVPAATASSFFTSTSTKPCFIAGNAGYEISPSAKADYVVRIDNSAPSPSLRMQVVDNPAAADFVLVDDGDAIESCKSVTAIKSVHLDPAAAKPDVTLALSRSAGDYKIFVQSANYSEQDAAALFAVIWQRSAKTGSRSRDYAQRN